MRITYLIGTIALLFFSLQLSRGQFLASMPTATISSLKQSDDSLTIDQELQQLGEKLLDNKQGSIVVIEPSTGKILAMVNKERINDGINRAIAMEYSPGSTFKVAQTLALMSEGALTPETTYPCKKRLLVR